MKKIKIDKKIIEHRIKLIETHLQRLQKLKGLSVGQFMLSINFDNAAWNLRCALESSFDICAHILARIPGVEIDEYKQMAIEMGKQKIIPIDFAKNKLCKMAGYRNRLTHFYFEVTPEEMYQIIQKNLGDFDFFLKYIKKLLTRII
ncbi:MAG: HepT-like ribonuclease domain-containing protein [Candidatus Kuenenbacteria bacterium]